MQNLICKLKKEIIENDNVYNNVKVKSYYKYDLNPTYLNHNENFISKYDDKTTFYPYSNYNGNKYNLKREFDNDPVIHYKADNFLLLYNFESVIFTLSLSNFVIFCFNSIISFCNSITNFLLSLLLLKSS